MFTSRRTVHIEWGDCDPANIVFFPRYFAWFDASTAHHFAAAGLPKPELVSRYGIVGFPVVDARAQFLVPSGHGEDVTIETAITRFGRTSFDVQHRLLRADTLAVEGFTKRVFVERKPDGEGIRACPIAGEIVALFE